MKNQADVQPPFMGEFKPLADLWGGEGAPYPSEVSARWAVRQMKNELADAGAVALHRGRLFVHPVKFAEVAQRRAVEAMRKRYGSRHET